MSNAKIITVSNQKGGVGKTNVVRNLSYALSEQGKKVLTVDFDAQFNLTTSFGIDNPRELPYTVATVLSLLLDEKEIPVKEEYIQHIGGVDLIPSSIELSVTDTNMRFEMGSEYLLSTLLQPLRSEYDVILIDTSPSLGSLTINALTACDEVIIPVNPQLLAVMGLQELVLTILKIKRRLNPQISFGGIVFTMCDKRTNLCKEINRQVKEAYSSGIYIFDTQIPLSTKVGEATLEGKSVIEHDRKCSASQEYLKFAEEAVKLWER